MKSILKAFYAKPLAVYLIAALIALSTFAGPAEAMFISAAPPQTLADAVQTSGGRAADLARIQTTLESRIIRQKLMDYGLSPEETLARVNKLSDRQIHEFAAHTDSIQAGSDGGDVVVSLVVIALLVVLLVFLLKHRVEVR
jgi:hypothetical protein